jgi:hypothetical protein
MIRVLQGREISLRGQVRGYVGGGVAGWHGLRMLKKVVWDNTRWGCLVLRRIVLLAEGWAVRQRRRCLLALLKKHSLVLVHEKLDPWVPRRERARSLWSYVGTLLLAKVVAELGWGQAVGPLYV